VRPITPLFFQQPILWTWGYFCRFTVIVASSPSPNTTATISTISTTGATTTTTTASTATRRQLPLQLHSDKQSPKPPIPLVYLPLSLASYEAGLPRWIPHFPGTLPGEMREQPCVPNVAAREPPVGVYNWATHTFHFIVFIPCSI
jgi:hypothetical protein